MIPFRGVVAKHLGSFGSLGAIAAVVLFAALSIGLAVLWRQKVTTRA